MKAARERVNVSRASLGISELNLDGTSRPRNPRPADVPVEESAEDGRDDPVTDPAVEATPELLTESKSSRSPQQRPAKHEATAGGGIQKTEKLNTLEATLTSGPLLCVFSSRCMLQNCLTFLSEEVEEMAKQRKS
jgi:hypothetical protein